MKPTPTSCRTSYRRGVALGALVLLTGVGRSFADDTPEESMPHGTILFSSLAPRGWELYVAESAGTEARRLTDHPALDYNAAFSPDGRRIAFVSERDGNLELYVFDRDGTGLTRLTDNFALDDHPAWSPDGSRIAFSSTRQPAAEPGRSWNAVYVMRADGTGVVRISPTETSDYSPAWSPDGEWIAVASGSGVPGGTDLYVMKPDGSDRKLVIDDGGWPDFAADSQSLFFHREQADKRHIWRVKLDGSNLERVTPEEVDAYTPRASDDGDWLVVATRRNQHRQIERFELATKEFTPVTEEPADHWNPSISPRGQIVFHRSVPEFRTPNVELWGSPPGHKTQLLRLNGAFPAVSPDGNRVALTGGNFSRLDVMNVDGNRRRNIFASEPRNVFSLSWSRGAGVGELEGSNGLQRIAFSHGKAFQEADGKVDIETIAPDGSARKALTQEAGNNGFPSFSPDGRQLVFRSGRGGSKNLYIMNSDGSGVRRLTDGKWTDTMADWSPTGEWIAFASNRGGTSFEIWLIKPDGSGLRKLIGGDVRHNHPHFAPNGRWIVFTSQRAGLSAEEISLPHQFQPYGDLFAVRLDGGGLVRLTHNGFEEGTPAWGSATNVQPSGEGGTAGGYEY